MSTGVLLFVVVRSTELILEIARIKYGIDQFERSVTFFFFLKYLAFSLTLLALFLLFVGIVWKVGVVLSRLGAGQTHTCSLFQWTVLNCHSMTKKIGIHLCRVVVLGFKQSFICQWLLECLCIAPVRWYHVCICPRLCWIWDHLKSNDTFWSADNFKTVWCLSR